jgi:hypothetical protein
VGLFVLQDFDKENKMKKTLQAVLVVLVFASLASAQQTETLGAAQVPNNSAMLSVVVNPEPTHVGDGGPFDWSVAIVPTATMPSGHLSVSAILLGGIRLSLMEQDVPSGYVSYGYYPLDGPTQGGHYILASLFYGVPSRAGLTLANGKLPVGVVVEATFTPEPKFAVDYKPFTVRTTSVITGAEESPDRSSITISGAFNPATPAYIYFTREPVPVRPEAVTVLADRIVIDLTKDSDTAHWAADTYSVVVYQPASAKAGAIDDTVLLIKSDATPSRTTGQRQTFPERRQRPAVDRRTDQ